MPRKPPRIADNPSFSKLRTEVRGAKLLLKLRPLLAILGVQLDGSLDSQLAELDATLQDLSTLPDRFNDLFAERGWIAYELLNTEVTRRAVELGEAGEIDAAEQLLADHFDAETIRWGIKFLWAVEAFRPRERLAELARIDYLQERYHACVPVLLMIIDGFANDVSRSKGFFAEGTDLIAWDSIAAHSRGLQTLAELWGRSRKKTTTDPISVPYRHGILHGRDLAYDNKLVAAKLWAALFALREWALAVRDDRVQEPAPTPQPSLRESLEQYRRVQEEKARLESWSPRSEEELAVLPRSGEPDVFAIGSPERAIAELMHLWSRRNYGHLARLVYRPLGPPKDEEIGPIARELREQLADKRLVGYEIVKIEDDAAAATNVRVRIEYERSGEQVERELDLRLLFIDDNGGPLVRGSDRGHWTVLHLWTLT